MLGEAAEVVVEGESAAAAVVARRLEFVGGVELMVALAFAADAAVGEVIRWELAPMLVDLPNGLFGVGVETFLCTCGVLEVDVDEGGEVVPVVVAPGPDGRLVEVEVKEDESALRGVLTLADLVTAGAPSPLLFPTESDP